ncbi:hypothetical protein NQ318_009809 [Aromia moschata]|uniref:Uncharacterized protein n=1 Tax=Aromia moschata TaxID=1265417 RepID=A0AAV8XNT6_9CUCU|nr:hypothetical protein NQ318_009809 [Aromia moschata]
MSEHVVPSSVAQRIITKFLSIEGVRPSENLTRLLVQFGDETLSKTQVSSNHPLKYGVGQWPPPAFHVRVEICILIVTISDFRVNVEEMSLWERRRKYHSLIYSQLMHNRAPVCRARISEGCGQWRPVEFDMIVFPYGVLKIFGKNRLWDKGHTR